MKLLLLFGLISKYASAVPVTNISRSETDYPRLSAFNNSWYQLSKESNGRSEMITHSKLCDEILCEDGRCVPHAWHCVHFGSDDASFREYKTFWSTPSTTVHYYMTVFGVLITIILVILMFFCSIEDKEIVTKNNNTAYAAKIKTTQEKPIFSHQTFGDQSQCLKHHSDKFSGLKAHNSYASSDEGQMKTEAKQDQNEANC